MEKKSFEIRKATKEFIVQINSVIEDSKKFWNYPETYLAQALPLLRIDEAYLSENPSFAIFIDQQVVGFFALTSKGFETHLDHLWISPKWIGSGFGKTACSYIFDYCTGLGIKEVVTYPDPPAEGFYLKQGFSDTGKRIPSRIPGGPIFSVFKKDL